MNSTAKRFGKAAGAGESAKAGWDASHGRAMVTPAPRSTARREILLSDFGADSGTDSGVRLRISFTFPGCLHWGICSPLVQKLRARNNDLHQWSEAVTVRSQFGLHSLHHEFIGEQERPAESEGQQFTAEIVEEVFLAMLADVGQHTLETVAWYAVGKSAAAGKNRSRINRPSRQIVGTLL